MMILRIVISLAVLALAGCVNIAKIPDEELGAKPATIELIPKDDTFLFFYRNGENCTNRMIPSKEAIEQAGGDSFPLPPNEKIAVVGFYNTLVGLTRLKYCRVVAVFTPEEGMDYTLSIKVQTDRCSAQLLSRKQKSYDSWLEVKDVDWRKFKTPMFSDGEFCEPTGVKPDYYLNQTGPLNIYVPRP
ncbi:hypothetical protein FCV66_13005 [Enterovibrio norvegicus]|uniref:hypothetical protein n=1 Tax=Enterovibrio norvegicus TaxID=188144 RepID=UPI001054CBCC|nr:hypothetical protein [Enterovibrio norvegicus]TKF13537.1 hypothetical protein FCV66_13005 [Enterovibrio norvegicus]